MDPIQTEEHPHQSDQMPIPQLGTERNAAPNTPFPIPQPKAHPQQQPKALLAQPVKNPETTVDKAIKTNSLSLTAVE